MPEGATARDRDRNRRLSTGPRRHTTAGMGVASNFSFLAARDERFAQLGALAERYFSDDAPSALIKLRQLGEFIAKDVAARHGLLPDSSASFDDVLRTLRLKSVLPREVSDLLFHLKRVGNAAAHENAGTAGDAFTALKIARQAAITSEWRHKNNGGSAADVLRSVRNRRAKDSH